MSEICVLGTGMAGYGAAHKLREGRLSIGQIALDIGYESEAAFTRAFKRELGSPPATWRREALQPPPPAD